MNVMQSAIDQVKNSEFDPNFIMYNVNGKVKVFKRKPIPQRTYTRNGTIFKTVDGVRRKFGKIMVLQFKAIQDIDEETIKREIVFSVNEQLKKLNICPEIAYIPKPAEVGIYGRDFIENMFTVQIKFERVKPK